LFVVVAAAVWYHQHYQKSFFKPKFTIRV
jgi:hypothetical protein